MGDAAPLRPMTPTEYLAFERASEQKHEYADGEVFAMAGTSRAHSLISANLLAALHAPLVDQPCEVHGPDMKVRASQKPRYHYPDVSVVCGPPEFEDDQRDVLLNPCVVAEVLSDSTERYDRGDKFGSYRSLASLQDYLLVSQKSVQIEHYHRLPDGTWLLRILGPGETLSLPSLACTVAVDAVFAKVFPTG